MSWAEVLGAEKIVIGAVEQDSSGYPDCRPAYYEAFQQLIRMKYTGFVDLEYEIKPDDPLPGVMESFAYMRGVLRGLGYDTAE